LSLFYKLIKLLPEIFHIRILHENHNLCLKNYLTDRWTFAKQEACFTWDPKRSNWAFSIICCTCCLSNNVCHHESTRFM